MITDSIFGNGFAELDELAKAATSAFGTTFPTLPTIQKITDKIDFPLDQYTEPDGTFVVEVAVVGLSGDDIKVTVKTEGGNNYLTIKAVQKELTEDEKKAVESRKYSMRKIKRGTKLELSRLLPSNLDIRKTSKKVENGLLTITIPIKEEEKPIEIEVE